MRPRFHWDAYDQVNYNLSFLCNSPYKDIIQLVGCHNRTGVNFQFIMDNCKAKFVNAMILSDAVNDLQRQGLIRAETYKQTGEVYYYKVNWSVIKQINNAIKRMP